jgi:hypothetical protein
MSERETAARKLEIAARHYWSLVAEVAAAKERMMQEAENARNKGLLMREIVGETKVSRSSLYTHLSPAE